MSIQEKQSSSIDGKRSDHLHKDSREARMSDALERKNTRKNYELQNSLKQKNIMQDGNIGGKVRTSSPTHRPPSILIPSTTHRNFKVERQHPTNSKFREYNFGQESPKKETERLDFSPVMKLWPLSKRQSEFETSKRSANNLCTTLEELFPEVTKTGQKIGSMTNGDSSPKKRGKKKILSLKYEKEGLFLGDLSGYNKYSKNYRPRARVGIRGEFDKVSKKILFDVSHLKKIDWKIFRPKLVNPEQIDIYDRLGNTPLYYACRNQNIEFAEF
jgi:hypothetical protein